MKRLKQGPARHRIQHAQRLLQHERFREALAVLDNRAPSTHVSTRAMFLRAIALHGMGEHRSAIQLLRQLGRRRMKSALRARCLWEEAFAHTKCGLLDEASALLENARAACDALGGAKAQQGRIRCNWLAASIALRRGLFAQAHEMASGVVREAAVQDMRRIQVYAACTSCVALRLLGRYREMDEVIEWAMPLAKRCQLHYRTAVLHYEAATALCERGDEARARHHLVHAERRSEITGAKLLQADIYTLHANMAAARHQINTAILHHRRASKLYREAGLLSGVALCHRNIGHLYLNKSDYPRALKAAQHAERLAQRSGDGRMKRLAELLMGVIFRWTGNRERAIAYLNQVAEACESVQDWSMASTAVSELAHVVSPDDQAATLSRAIWLAERIEHSSHSALTQRILAEFHLKSGNAEQALICAEASMQFFNRAGARLYAGASELVALEARLVQAEQDSSALRTDRLNALVLKMESLTREPRRLPEYSAHLAHLRARVFGALGDSQSALLAAVASARAESWVRATVPDPVLASYLAANSQAQYWRHARMAFEYAHADTLLMLAKFRRSEWTQRLRLPLLEQDQQRADALLADIRRHRRHLLRQAWPALNPSDGEAAEAAQLQSAYQQMDLLQFATRGSPLVASQSNRDALTVLQMQAALCERYSTDWTLIIIEATAAEDEWVVLKMTPTHAQMRRLYAKGLLKRILNASTTPDWHYPQVIYASPASAALATLADWLDVEHWLPEHAPCTHRVIIADCTLFTRLGFGALPTSKGLLGHRAVLSFCPSLRIGGPHMQRGPASPASTHALFVAAPAGTAGDLLQGVSEEVMQCATYWPQATVLQDEAANVMRVKQHIDEADPALIHFASHVCHDPEMPRLSALLLNDHALSALEIMRWQVKAKLVCLTGCEGGRAWQLAGEERLSVESAWMAAGADEVLSTPWSVHDLAAVRLLTSFHQHYAAGQDAALALHRAACDQPPDTLAHWAGWRIMTRALG